MDNNPINESYFGQNLVGLYSKTLLFKAIA